jgi:hypothetical protein
MLNLRHLITTLALAAVLSPAAYAASSDKTFTVSNTGDGPLTITGAGITGNTAEFSLLAGHNCTTVAAGSSCAMTVRFTPAGSNARNQAWLNFTSNGTNGGVHSIPLSGAGGVSEVTRTIATSTSNVNMAALFGYPSVAGTYVLTINSGVYVTASSTAVAALTTGTFPAGSTLKLINYGTIAGRGGNGGAGAGVNCAAGTVGLPGGPGLSASQVLAVTNNGVIQGGGGGGGGGQGLKWQAGKGYYGSTGGGGGVGGDLYAAGAGSAGSVTGSSYGGAGGYGGAAGSAGATGAMAYVSLGTITCSAGPYAGGASGAAVVGNANITWDVPGTRLGPIWY